MGGSSIHHSCRERCQVARIKKRFVGAVVAGAVAAALGPSAMYAMASGADSKTASPRISHPPVAGFGTINGLGQSAEHEKITRAALACKGGEAANSCFQPVSLNQVAGESGTFGAVGSPDSDQTFEPRAHCDDADYLNVAGYPQSRAKATTTLLGCIAYLKSEFTGGVTSAGAMMSNGSFVSSQVSVGSDCTFVLGVPGRAKCNAIEGFGRALHGVQDFYSHSNWADKTDPSKKISVTNPPGLNHSGPAPFLNMAAPAPSASAIPADLTTGCFTLAPFGWGCGGRVTHDVLNKDTGTIDPNTGAASAATTDRGRVGNN